MLGPETLATKMHLLRKIISIINTSCGVTTCGVSACGLKKVKGHIFYCDLWKCKSCGDSLFPVSASGYFVFRIPQISSVCLPVCLFHLSDHQVLPEQLTLSLWYSQQLNHIPWLHFISPFLVLSVCPTSPLLPVSQRPPRDNVHALMCPIVAV